MTVLVRKLGGSVAVVIPKALAKEMELADGTPLDLVAADGGIMLRKRGRRPRRRMSEIVSQIKPASYRRRTKEMGDAAPVGKEAW